MELIWEVLKRLMFVGLLDRATGWAGHRWDTDLMVPGGLRVVEGRLPGLTERWDRKYVRVRYGRLRYRRWYLRTVTVTITSVEPVSDTVARVESENAVLELSMPDGWMTLVRNSLRPKPGQ